MELEERRPTKPVYRLGHIYGVAWVSLLRRTLAAEALRLGMKDIDLSSLEKSRAAETHAARLKAGLPAELRGDLLSIPVRADARELGDLRTLSTGRLHIEGVL